MQCSKMLVDLPHSHTFSRKDCSDCRCKARLDLSGQQALEREQTNRFGHGVSLDIASFSEIFRSVFDALNQALSNCF